jgi:flagellar biosynthesis/type III secretory pathway protein FliH
VEGANCPFAILIEDSNVTHRVKTAFAPTPPTEELMRNQLAALSNTKNIYEQEIKKIRSELAVKLKTTRNSIKKRANVNLQKQIQKLQVENLKSIEIKYKQVAEQAEQDCFELAISLAKKIIGESIENCRSNLKDRIKSILPRLSLSRKIKIAAHPTEIPSIHELCHLNSPQLAIDLVADSKISLGNARIESASGAVEVSWEAHFESLVDLLKRHHTAQTGGYDA